MNGRDAANAVIVAGANGFVGGAITAVLSDLALPTVAVIRSDKTQLPQSVTRIHADLLDGNRLSGLIPASRAVIHAASYTGSDPAAADAVNREGTQNLLNALHRQADPPRLIYISTIGVYGLGPQTNLAEGDAAPAPVTPLSASRVAAEEIVLSAGGVVIRPGFIYGPGDRWFLPGVAQLHRQLGHWVDDGAARISVIHINDLARAAVAIALRAAEPAHAVYHAAEPEPLTLQTIATAALGAEYVPAKSVKLAEATKLALLHRISERELDLIGHDHWLNSDQLWRELNTSPRHQFRAVPTDTLPSRLAGKQPLVVATGPSRARTNRLHTAVGRAKRYLAVAQRMRGREKR